MNQQRLLQRGDEFCVVAERRAHTRADLVDDAAQPGPVTRWMAGVVDKADDEGPHAPDYPGGPVRSMKAG
jgi:hypothetical protein